jgi:succinoglycan biosynthesis protein ExoA
MSAREASHVVQPSSLGTLSASVVIPALNEACYIEACLKSVLAQEIDGAFEVIVVDGDSTDDTAAVARRLGVRVIANPKRSISAGLNRGLTAARADVVVRFDAHSEMTPGYLRASLRALAEEEGAVNVAGWLHVVAEGPWGRALAAALASPFGVGNARIWRKPRPDMRRCDVDTVPFGCFPTSALRDAQGWREDILANEDYELNYRLRRRGGRIVFDPEIWSIYRPRESYPDIVRQYWRYGRWKAVMISGAWESLKPRQVAPIGLLAVACAAPFSRHLRVALLGYASVVTAVAVHSRGGWRTAPTLASMHAAWGAGFLTQWVHDLHASRTCP